MAQTEANTRQSAWMFSIDILAFLLLISLNGLPYFVSMWADQIVGKQTSSVVFKPILLQCIDDLQESLVLFLQPLFDNFAFDVLCNEEDIKDRRLITKADAFTTVVRVCAIKLPSVAVTLLMILPKTTLSASVCILTAVAWSSVIPRSAKTVQDEKKERDNSLSEKKPEAEEHQRKYLQSLSSLSMRLFSWKMLRHGCLFLFALCSPGLDPTLMTRFVHQVAALEAVMLKWVQSYHRAGDIIQVLSKNKLPDQSTVAAVIQGLRAGSDRSCTVAGHEHNPGCLAFGVSIQGTGGLVQQLDIRISEKQGDQRQLLLFFSRKSSFVGESWLLIIGALGYSKGVAQVFEDP
ncbi:hypothetical protein Ct61P_06423 [Colletotrichum tofieldiae]|nr:hypothetical protein Ct61P_06423 [Colletotrichum tofieldiae]